MSNRDPATKAQDLPPAVARACCEIRAFVAKLEHATEKISQYKTSIAQHVAAIKKARPNDWKVIVETECGFKSRQAYYYLALIEGTQKTVEEAAEEQRAKNRERVARYRHRSALRNAQDPPQPDLPAYFADPEAAREHDQNLAEELRLAEIKLAGLEGEIADLNAEKTALLEQIKTERKLHTRVGELLREARGLTGHLPHTSVELTHKINQAAKALADSLMTEAPTRKTPREDDSVLHGGGVRVFGLR